MFISLTNTIRLNQLYSYIVYLSRERSATQSICTNSPVLNFQALTPPFHLDALCPLIINMISVIGC